jgi:Ca2+-binding RTX toxin-like protein
MANYTYGTPPFTTTTFTAPVAGTSDTITANALFDFTINGNGGNDRVTTAGGNDTITTGSGNDIVNAGNGNNTVTTSGGGTDFVTTGSGNDTITTGGSGNDTVNAGNGNNTVTTGSGADVVNSGSGNDKITTNEGADNVVAGSGDDIISTGSGNDIINAGAGNDIVNAGTGNDMIRSGGGTDSLTGGGGHDTFQYGSLTNVRLGADTISDFSTASFSQNGEGDRLDLRGLVDDFSRVGDNTSLARLVASGHLDFSAGGGGTVISYDSNGSASGGSIGVLATLVGVGFSTEAAAVAAFADNILV